MKLQMRAPCDTRITGPATYIVPDRELAWSMFDCAADVAWNGFAKRNGMPHDVLLRSIRRVAPGYASAIFCRTNHKGETECAGP